MVASVIILSLRPVRPMRPDARDGKCIFRDGGGHGNCLLFVVSVLVIVALFVFFCSDSYFREYRDHTGSPAIPVGA